MSANGGSNGSASLHSKPPAALPCAAIYIGHMSEEKELRASRSSHSVMVDVSIAGTTPRTLVDVWRHDWYIVWSAREPIVAGGRHAVPSKERATCKRRMNVTRRSTNSASLTLKMIETTVFELQSLRPLRKCLVRCQCQHCTAQLGWLVSIPVAANAFRSGVFIETLLKLILEARHMFVEPQCMTVCWSQVQVVLKMSKSKLGP